MIRLAKTLSILAISLAAPLAAADFFPLRTGSYWTYRDAASGAAFTVRVGLPVFANQNEYHMLRGYGAEPLLVRINEFGNLVHYDEETRTELMITAFELAGGAQFEAHKRECPEWGRAKERRGFHEGPAGRWSVLEIEYQPYACADAGDQLEQFAENIGLVRRVVNTIAGPRTYDLVYARVGNQTIESNPSGGFTVSAAPAAGRGWIATLRVALPPGDAIRVSFPTSQEYEVKLRDESGRILWTWSADKLFLQAFHEVNLSGGWTAQVEVPSPPAVPEDPHRYIIEAYLTTAPGEPQFAAAVVVETPGAGPAAARAARPQR
jgi:hypothetical protein